MQLTLDVLRDIVDRGIDMTGFITSGLAARNTLAPSITSKPAVHGMRVFSSVNAHIHSTTHIEFPWTFRMRNIKNDEWPGGERPFPTFRSSKAQEILLEYHRPKVLSTILLDFSDKRRLLADVLDQFGVGTREAATRMLGSSMPAAVLRSLLQDLKIGFDEILGLIGDRQRLKETFLVFFTGWEKWRPQFRDVSHPVFESWHPFLLHPYLDATGIEKLSEAGVAGVGIDTYGIECPLYYADPHLSMPAVTECVEEMERTRRLGNRVSLPLVPPVHFHVLKRRRLIVESLYLTKSLFCDQQGNTSRAVRRVPFGNKSKFRTGLVILQPTRIGDPEERECPRDGTFVRVTFFPEEGKK